MKIKPKPFLQQVQPYVPGKPIDEVKRELGLRRVVKLASNENPYGPSPRALEAIQKAAASLNRYPTADCFYLREILAKRLKVTGDQLIFGNGSDELIVLAARAVVHPGDHVIIAQPSFLIYDIASRLEGADVKKVPLRKDFRYDLDGMADLIDAKTRIVFLGNPDNPGGQYLRQEETLAFLRRVPSDVLVFIDEAYYEYVEEKDYLDSLAILKRYSNVFITRTFSKMYGLAGLRVGYGIGHRAVTDMLNRLREPFNVNSLAQVAAVACLKDRSYYRTVAASIHAERAYLYRQLDQLKLAYVPSSTNFILVHLQRDAGPVVKKMLTQGVVVRDMSAWGLSHYFRVSIGTHAENLRFVRALKESL